MRTSPIFAHSAKAVVWIVLWFCAANLLVAMGAAQCSNPTVIPNQTISSGSVYYTDENALAASNVVISGDADVTFMAGNCIELRPGFRANMGSTFHAWLQTVANVSAATVTITGGGKGPPTAAVPPCGGAPSCTFMASGITYLSPTRIYGESSTFTTGPNRGYFSNFTSSRMLADGQDLGFVCSTQAESVGDAIAKARVPCSPSTNFYLYSPKLHVLVGRHRGQAAQADTGILETYDNLSFVAAGETRTFNSLKLGPFGDFRTAGPPTVWPTDGLTVQYTNRTINTASVRVQVPSSARKGWHQIGFPANDRYGAPQNNYFFEVIVYDATPAITTISPTPVTPDEPTTLTITGSGFGDNPTVYVDGTAYHPGPPSTNPQGQDVLELSVTVPLPKAGSSIPVYLVSNGSGGQPFFGAPQGAQQASATSNTKQLQVTAGRPTISGSSGIWYLGTASVNDNCDPNSPVPNCYYNATLLTLTPGPGGMAPTPSSPAVWTVTDPVTGQPPTFASFSCADGPCSRIILTATAQPTYCRSLGNLEAKVSLGGVSSTGFSVVQDWPQTTTVLGSLDTVAPSTTPGYVSISTVQLLSACGRRMFNIAWHEEFPTDAFGNPANWNACQGSSGWTVPVPKLPAPPLSTGWGHGLTDADAILMMYDPDMTFDGVGYACSAMTSPPCTPQSAIPGGLQTPPQNPSTTPNAWSYRFIFAGSQDITSLGKYWPAAPNKLVRYTDHGTVEAGTWSCPTQ